MRRGAARRCRHAQAMRGEHRGPEHDADLDVRHPEEAAAVQLPAACQRRHGRRPAERGLDREDPQDDAPAGRQGDEDPSASLDPSREHDTRDHDRDEERSHGGDGQGRQVPHQEEAEREPRQRPDERSGDREDAGRHAPAERQREDPREAEDQHQTPRGGGGGHGEPALLEVALVEVQRRRLAGPLHRRAGVVREAEPIGDGRGGVDVGDDAGSPRRVGGEGVRLTLARRGARRDRPMPRSRCRARRLRG